MATPRPDPGRVPHPLDPRSRVPARPARRGRAAGTRARRLGRALVPAVTASLTVTLLTGTAAADPPSDTGAERAARLVAEPGHRLGAVTGQVDGARRQREQQQAAGSPTARIAVDTALAQVGDAYVVGAGGPDAFDCSGLTQYAYAAAGISLPHSTPMQSQLGTPVSRGDLRPGDLVFSYSPVTHVSMYVGNGRVVHAPTSGQPVSVVGIDSVGGITGMRRIAG